ncbi:mitogen-activated protein kinase kinase kinase 5-like [Neltuma alba]|uniref:mitogen-activated protein kinase kinase kinase 5-like n=1 Tax=Neltuma alba TaxID=207710 RepID=UPI0010A33066|nr:mitogen-activated protein kinase kinase kinase 5-like [Prosopis alba]
MAASMIKQGKGLEQNISLTRASSFNTDLVHLQDYDSSNNSISSATNFSQWETEDAAGAAEVGAVSLNTDELVDQNDYDSPGSVSSCTSAFSQWEIRDPPIGGGEFASVHVACNRETGHLSAVKKLKDPDNPDNIKEIEILSQLEHPNIIKYYGSERVGNQIWLLMEYVETGTLTRYISERGAFHERLVKDITFQILSALAYLHSKRIVHRDIKADNILVDSYGFVKLIDFGLAKHGHESMGSDSLWGTSHYAAPETLQNQEYSSSGEAYSADICSLGCVIIEMFTGKRPWLDLDWRQVNREVCWNKPDPEIPMDLSTEGQEFVQLCFERNPAKRLSASELLQHPFLSS